MMEIRYVYIKFWSKNLMGRDRAGGRIILEWILGKWGGKLWTG